MVLAWTATGEEKVTSCQPDADSPEKVAVASRVPVRLQSVPTWLPVLASAL